MPKSPSQVPNSFPPALGFQILKSETQRQAAIIRQEILTDLVTLLDAVKDPAARKKLIGLIETHFKAGTRALEKSQELWPDTASVREEIEAQETKPATQQKNLKLFEQFDAVHGKSIALLQTSFEHIHVILEKAQFFAPIALAEKPK